jgi:hypothetical protein
MRTILTRIDQWLDRPMAHRQSMIALYVVTGLAILAVVLSTILQVIAATR